MSTVLTPTSPTQEDRDRLDPFRFGWRTVKRIGPDGAVKFEDVPMTLEDALHPQEEDRYTLSQAHIDDRSYLKGVFRWALADEPKTYVLADCCVAWDANADLVHGPDIMVVFNVAEKKPWRTFNVVEEGTRPALIIEVTSKFTRDNDVETKVKEYAQVGVPRYVIVDIDESNGERTIAFIHYQLAPRRKKYEEVAIGANGRVWLPEVGLWLGCANGQVACFDKHGKQIADHKASIEGRAAADVRADAAERLAAEHASEIERLQAELRRLRESTPPA